LRGVDVIVDACQARIEAETVTKYLRLADCRHRFQIFGASAFSGAFFVSSGARVNRRS
jgi:hypothetical protein